MSAGTTDPRKKHRLIVMGPVPPPIHGVAVSTALTLANPFLRERFEIEHIDTTDPRSLSNIGVWDATNVTIGFRNLLGLVKRLRGRRGVVYLPLSANLAAFMRDSLFIHAATLAGWKVAVHIRNSIFRDFYESSSLAPRWWMRFTVRRIASIAVLGAGVRTMFDGLVPRERIAVVPNGTPDVVCENGARVPNRVLFLSSLREAKGIVEAVEAALIVVRRNPEAEFVFAGEWRDEALERVLRKRARNGNGRIRFVSAVDGEEKEQLLQSCSVLLFPPKGKEGHPRVLLEAICRGIPIVTTNRGTIPETVRDGESAFVLANPDPEKIAEHVLELLDDDALRERMGTAARRRYEAEYTQDAADRKLAEWLSGVAENPAR